MTFLTRKLLAGAGLVLALGFATPASAGVHATSIQAQALLDKAVSELKAVGPDKALAEFNTAEDGYNTHELYVFVVNLDGVYEAYGADPKLVGTNVLALADVEGKPIVQQMIALAKNPGYGKLDYLWLNRADNRVEHKHSVIERVGNHVVGVGYYTG